MGQLLDLESWLRHELDTETQHLIQNDQCTNDLTNMNIWGQYVCVIHNTCKLELELKK
jgi:hypothetical protein